MVRLVTTDLELATPSKNNNVGKIYHQYIIKYITILGVAIVQAGSFVQ